jgi:hypothetical protein
MRGVDKEQGRRIRRRQEEEKKKEGMAKAVKSCVVIAAAK